MEQANKGSAFSAVTRHMYNVAGKEDASQMQQLEKYFPLPPTNYVEKKNKLSQLKSKNNVKCLFH